MNEIVASMQETWSKLSRPMQIGVGVLVLGVFVFLVSLMLISSTEYEVLFSNLQPEDAGAVVAGLQERGIPYQLTDNGTAVMVPKEQVLDTRIALATVGLPTGGVVGFEMFNSMRLGETEADRQLRYQWALQGELTRTIRQIDEIVDARIHIVLPQRSLFIQESQPSSASLLLQLKPGSNLTGQQVRAISNLVATSVEGLTTENVTIVDNKGNVLNSSSPLAVNGELFATRFEIERAFEKRLEDNVTAMLERIHGYGNVVTRVSATLDFDHYEEYKESFSPINRDEGLIRSQEIFQEQFSSSGVGQGGVPGVDSNIPGYVVAGQTGDSDYLRDESVINYELNRTETHLVSSPGQVQNLSVAVWLNGELNPNQLMAVEDSVSRAIGLQTQRGDSIYVDSMLFESSDLDGMWVGETTQVVTPNYLIYIIIALLIIGIISIYFALRNRRREEAMAPVAASLDVIVDDESFADAISDEARSKEELRRKIEAAAKEQPNVVAQLVRTWLTDE